MLNFTVFFFLWSVSYLSNGLRQGESLDIYRKQKPKWTIEHSSLLWFHWKQESLERTGREEGINISSQACPAHTHKEKKMKIKLRNFFFCFSLLFSSSSSRLPKGSLPRKVIAMYFSGISRPKTVGNGSSS